jgi:hypothetical protein
LDFPARGIRLTAPAGWRRIVGDQGKSVVSWASPDSTPADPRAVIKVEAARGLDATAEASARKLAADWGGTVSAEKLVLDGEPAFRVLAANTTPALKPVEGIVASHNGFLYMVLGGVTAGHECHRQIEEIAKGWKWEELVAPSEHLDFWPQPLAALDGHALLNHPVDMHFYETKHPDRILDLGLYDMRTNTTPFLAYVQLMPMPQDKSFAAFADSFLQGLNERKMVDDTLVWRRFPQDSTRLVTPSVHSASGSQKLKQEVYMKFATLQLDRGHVVLINFTIVPADEKERERYEAAADAMVLSVQESKRDRR